MTVKDATSNLPSLSVIGLYSSPKTKVKEIKNAIKRCCELIKYPAVILGDFNYDLLTKTSNSLWPSTHTQCLKEPTTDLNTMIDHIYTDFPEQYYTAGVYESYFSYHKPIHFSLA